MTFVASNLYGRMDKFEKLIKKINLKDTALRILQDVELNCQGLEAVSVQEDRVSQSLKPTDVI